MFVRMLMASTPYRTGFGNNGPPLGSVIAASYSVVQRTMDGAVGQMNLA
jgi:hypothetical protein